MEQIRAFIAIELPEGLKEELREFQSRLKLDRQSAVKWVNPDSIHLTLKFLGSVPESRLEGIKKAMKEAAVGIAPFHLEITELGVFPNPRRVQVIWVGLGGELEALGRLQKQVESNLVPLGFAPELRPFVAHLTLARVRDSATPDERQRLGELIGKTKFEPTHSIEVETVNLMRSQLTREGAIYSQIGSVVLTKPLSMPSA